MHEPLNENINRKPLRPQPSTSAANNYWELRIGNIRVFYIAQVEPAPLVEIIAIGEKERERVRIGGKLIAPNELIAVLDEIVSAGKE